ncbi:hypothetical protein ACSV9I_21825 [Rhizobium sp. G187]|uniref:hypothetical protein n=1 Tax=unclassified Rhizobium TaxID=2613769 RepID=UPI0006B9FD56|nr:hypothetical protein [Rhizobium sp. AAP43]KPF42571.1 hypothetical protein IP76_16635 [Rhizobium sp. AAP43]
MTTSGKIRIPQPVKRVTVDAGILPKAGSSAKPVSGEAKVNIVAPVAPKIAAARQQMRKQSAKVAIAKIDEAIEAGTVSAADAKKLVLALAVRRVGSQDAAEKWYRSHHIEAFGGRTAAQMVRGGELKALIEHMKAEAAAAVTAAKA